MSGPEVRPDGASGWLRGPARGTPGASRLGRAHSLLASGSRPCSVLDVLAAGLVVRDVEGGITGWNEAALELLGLSAEELAGLRVGDPKWKVLRADGRPLPAAECPLTGPAGCERRALEMGVQRSHGAVVWLSVEVRPVCRDGALEGSVASLVDVTARRRTEDALRDAHRRKDRFLAMLSHEMRDPLYAARNGLYILRHSAPGTPQASYALAVLDRQFTQLGRLVEDLLDVSRIGEGKLRLHLAPLDLCALARSAAEDCRAVFQAAGVELLTEVPPAPLWVQADGARLAQVLGNLLHNAAKFTPREGRATLSVALDARDRAVEVRVRDTGAGFDPALRERLFLPFEQLEAAGAREGGLGLGLALVKGLVELHGGTVEARSEGPGLGAEFSLRVPLGSAPGVSARTSGAPRIRPLRVLVIEDHEDSAATLQEVLAFLGHHSAVIHGGLQGVQAVRRFAPDIVLCDVGLPDLDGYCVARAVRAAKDLRQPVLVALTGHASHEDASRAADAGFDLHLAKPLSPDDLSHALASLSARTSGGRPGDR